MKAIQKSSGYARVTGPLGWVVMVAFVGAIIMAQANAAAHAEVTAFSTFITDNWDAIKTALYTLMLGGLILALIRKHGKRV